MLYRLDGKNSFILSKCSPRKHDGRKEEGRAQDIPPVAGNMQENGSDDISKDLAQRNIELVQRDQVTANATLDRLCDIDGDCTPLETDTKTKDDTRCNYHAWAVS